MAVSMAEISKLRALTQAGLMDCKKALQEAEGDMQAAVEILRKKGQAVAAKRADRDAAEGCVLSKSEGNYAAIVALNCETDFVAKNAGFVEVTQQILDAAVAAKVKDIEALKALTINGQTVADLVVEEGGKTGEKTELGAFEYVEAPSTAAYTHFGNKLATIVGFNQENISYEVGHDVAMQVASMNPVAVDRESVPQSVIDSETAIAIDKTKAEQVQKAVEVALKKAGINPNLVDSEDHMASNVAKNWITQEEVDKAKEIIAKVSAEKAANLPEAMIQNIVKGRLNSFFKDNTLMEQKFVKDGELTIGQYLEKSSKGLAAISFKRVNLNAD